MSQTARFTAEDMSAFEPEAKIGLLATVNPEGLPHITFINSIQAAAPEQLIWGQFTEGLSKQYVKTNPQTGFLIMTMDRSLWWGKARYTHQRTDGPQFEMYNHKPMFRYNAYFGIHTVHYMDLVETSGRQSLPLARIISASLLTSAVKWAKVPDQAEPILKPWAKRLFNTSSALKFMAWVGDDGFPVIFPVLQCQTAGNARLVFSTLAYGEEIAAMAPGNPVAVFCMSLEMESVLIRGTFNLTRQFDRLPLGIVDIDFVYNSMPPKPGRVYPPVSLSPVTRF